MLMIWAVAAGRIRFPSAGHEGITGKPVIVQTTNRLWQPFVARHSDQGVVSMSSLSSLSPDPNSARKRLLVVQPLVGIGDMVWHKPWIDHLAGSFDLILAAKPTAHATTLFHGTNGIVDWLDIDRSMRGRKGRHDGLVGLFRLAADFRRARADAVLVLHHSATYTLAACLAGIPLRWGYGIGGSRKWLNRGNFLGREARYERPYRKLGRYAQVNGFGLDQPHWQMAANDEAAQAVRAFCDDHNIKPDSSNGPDGRDMVVFGVGAMDAERQWPPSQFAQLAVAIRAEWPGLNIVLTGAPSEASIVQAVLSDDAAPAGLIEKAGPLDEAVALIGSARAYIGNDTSLLNIAAACGRPAVGFFAQTEPLDYSDNVIPVALPDGRFGEAGAIRRITVEQVFSVVAATLNKPGNKPGKPPEQDRGDG